MQNALGLWKVMAGELRPTADSRQAESRPATDGATVFAPLFRFAPSSIESVMCVSCDRLTLRPELAGFASEGNEDDMKLEGLPRVKRTLTTGSKFMWRGVSTGDFEGVEVTEFVSDPPPLREILDLKKFKPEIIDGVECFLREPYKRGNREEGPVEDWVATVDGRYWVQATRRAILKEALTKRGPTPAECLEKLGWDAARLNWDSPVVIVRKYDPSNQKDAYSPVSTGVRATPMTRGFRIEGMTFAYEDPKLGTARIELRTKDSLPALEYFRELLMHGRPSDQPSVTTVEQAELRRDHQVLRVQFHEHPDHLEALVILMLFGFNVFI
jgi:hypothetical protein